MNSVYVCSNCRHESASDLAACPACGRGPFYATSFPGRAGGSHVAQAAGHGAGDGRACYNCDYEVADASVKKCPQCGKGRVLTRAQARGLGWVLLVIGAFLVLFMGGITVLVAGIIVNANVPGSTNRFTGDEKQMAIMFGLFGLVIAFGFASVVAGASQIRHGRRNKTIVKVVLGILIAILVVGEMVFIFF
jgi:predicted RNA-binding Zn-ribbon protein involved in translation (DUF1610 family)